MDPAGYTKPTDDVAQPAATGPQYNNNNGNNNNGAGNAGSEIKDFIIQHKKEIIVGVVVFILFMIIMSKI